jgi:2-amino-4-hydroxy-6-hydroxymethyldihydropteridine diphosphokinase
MSTAYVALGSNLGDRAQNLMLALRAIQQESSCTLAQISSFYETEPLVLASAKATEWYWNAVVEVSTSWDVHQFFPFLLQLEVQMGRPVQREKWVSRVIDLDLLFFDREVFSLDTLVLPHPELHKRRFVLEPMAEIAPDLVHPVLGKSMKDLLDRLEESGTVVPLYRLFLKNGVFGF